MKCASTVSRAWGRLYEVAVHTRRMQNFFCLMSAAFLGCRLMDRMFVAKMEGMECLPARTLEKKM